VEFQGIRLHDQKTNTKQCFFFNLKGKKSKINKEKWKRKNGWAGFKGKLVSWAKLNK
jgi:hypothetical protein